MGYYIRQIDNFYLKSMMCSMTLHNMFTVLSLLKLQISMHCAKLQEAEFINAVFPSISVCAYVIYCFICVCDLH